MTWDELQTSLQAYLQASADRLAGLTPQDAIVLGLLLALLLASSIGYGIWRRRTSASAVTSEPAQQQDVPELSTADFLAQMRAEQGATEPAPVALPADAPVEIPASVATPASVDGLQQLRLEVAALQEQVRLQSSALLLQSEAIRALESYVALVDQQGGRESGGADYEDAVSLAARGLDAETLMARTGISATEAELILRLHGRRG